jgi:hypothetical protein
MRITNAAHLDFRLAPSASGPGSWVEAVVLAALVVGLGVWMAPADPLQVNAPFPWLALSPLLIGLRYGFTRALVNGCLIVIAYLMLHQRGPLYAHLSPAWIVGVLVGGMIAGEVRDLWERRLQRLQMANEYRQYRLDEFTRAHQILRVSHDRLEQRVAGSDESLRGSLLGLRDRLRRLPGDHDALSGLGESILTLLGEYGSLQTAGIYRVQGGVLQPQPVATVGKMGELVASDALVELCLGRGELVSVRDTLVENGQSQHFSCLQVCVPLIDTQGQTLALLAVRDMQFFAFHDRTFSVLALLCGHIADLLHADPQALQLVDADAQHFSAQLRRSLADVRQHGLSATLYAFEINEANTELARLFDLSRRGLDLHLGLPNNRGHRCLLVLLPLTSSDAALGYLQRLEGLLQRHFADYQGLDALGVQVFQYSLDAAPVRAGLRNFLHNECGLNDQQITL